VSPRKLQLLIGALFLLAWEVVPRTGLVPPVILAPLSETLAVPFDHFSVFASALLATLGEIIAALAIAYIGGGITGIIVGSTRMLRISVLPLISSAYAVPLVVVYPILTAWLGIGSESKIWFGGIYGFFPMALASAAGMQTVDARYVLAARAMGATKAQLIWQVFVPAAIPALISGLRLGGALVAIGVVVAEMMAATKDVRNA
jgi:NitT/TauT family transport system permease protein